MRISRSSVKFVVIFLTVLVGALVPSLPSFAQQGIGQANTLTSIRELLDGQRSREHVLLRGTITYTTGDLILQDQTGAIAVHQNTSASLRLGDQVEVQGDLQYSSGIPLISHANVRFLWAGSTPLPLAITPEEAAEGAYNGMLVAIEGELIKALPLATGGTSLTLYSDNQLFTCSGKQANHATATEFQPGAILRCTGVLSFSPPERAFESGTFLILLRNAGDVHVLTPAPWWTPRHIGLLFLAMLPLAFVAYRNHLRNVRARMTLVVEERSRIAREIHDTLAQGFAGIALQLQGVNRTMGEQSEAASSHLSMALQMVRRSRAEAHRSIAALRTLHSDENLCSMLERLLSQLTVVARLRLTIVEHGTRTALSDEVSGQVLRIAQEAVANVVEHAKAQSVCVTVTYSTDAVILHIADDGIGFQPEKAASIDQGHFGIAGMKERAMQIHATLTINSAPEGTNLRLEVPVATKSCMLPKLFRTGIKAVTPKPKFVGEVH